MKQIDLIEQWAEILSRKVDPVKEIKHEFTLEGTNVARRAVMNTLAKPENCLHCYEAMFELLKIHGADHLRNDVELGIRFYTAVCTGMLDQTESIEFQNPDQLVDQGIFNVEDQSKFERVKTAWVVSG